MKTKKPIYRIPFGKYKGKPLNNIPDSYLIWLNKIAKEELKINCLEEIANRFTDIVISEDESTIMDYPDCSVDWWKDSSRVRED